MKLSGCVLAIALSVLISACGGGGSGAGGGGGGAGSGTGGGAGGGNDPPATRVAARIEIEQSGLLLAGPGDKAQLRAKAFDAEGKAIDAAPVAWSSSRPGAIAVDAAGVATAVATGSSRIVASSGQATSAPLLAISTRLASGVVALSDDQIAGDPVGIAAAAPNGGDWGRHVVTLNAGGPVPAVGTLVVGSGAKAVAGRVVAVEAAGTRTALTVALVPMNELFPQLEIDEVLDLSKAAVAIPDELAAHYDLVRTGDTFEFTRKASVPAKGLGDMSDKPWLANALFSCEREGDLPFLFELPPVLKLTFKPEVEVKASLARGFEKLVVTGTPEFAIEGGVTVLAAFADSVECKSRPLSWPIPLGGALSIFLGGVVETGFGVEVEGKFTVVQMEFGTKVDVKLPLTLGLDCQTGAACRSVSSIGQWAYKQEPKLKLPGMSDYLRLEPALSGFGYADLKLGPLFLDKLEFLKNKLGIKLEASFAPQKVQALDDGYASSYQASAFFGAELGSDVKKIPELLGIRDVSFSEVDLSVPIGRSPTGKVVANRTTQLSGERVSVQVLLDQENIAFLKSGIGPYNVASIVLVKKTPRTLFLTEIGRKAASAGQREFNFDFPATDFAAGDQVHAFVITTLLPIELLALEIGSAPVSGASCPAAAPGTVRLPRVCLNPAFSLTPGVSRPITDFITIDPGNDPQVTYVLVGINFFRDTPSALAVTGATPTPGDTFYYGREVYPDYNFTAFGTDVYFSCQDLPQPHPASLAGSFLVDPSYAGASVSIPVLVVQYQRMSQPGPSCLGNGFNYFTRTNIYDGPAGIPVVRAAP